MGVCRINVWLLLRLLVRMRVSMAMMDVNHRQLQNVADHLTEEKCTLLLSALRESHHIMINTKAHGNKMSLGGSCVSRLEHWAKHDGQNATVVLLALRLRQIGMPQLASKLSENVLHETVGELQRHFLDDPFKDMLPANKITITDAIPSQKLVPAPDAKDKDEELFIAVVILLITFSILFCFTCCCILCPRSAKRTCERACPSLCSFLCEMMTDGCHKLIKGSSETTRKYMIGAPPGTEGEGLLI